ncbi:MAG: ribonuclease, partial [Mycobacteriales bacterium]
DDVLVEHYVTKASSSSYAGNVYLGRVQNVLPSMEAAFVDIGKARNAVLYAGEVDWDVAGLEGKARSIEHAMKSGDTLVVQVTKDPIGHKGARLTSQISLPGRYLVYVPGGSMTGISRKLPDTERSRLKEILRRIVPEDAGVIIRTAAEGASEEELTRDVKRLHAQWEVIKEKAAKSSHAPVLLSEEPDLAIRVVRDVFNEDFTKLIVSGDEAAETLEQYVGHVAPDLAPRMARHTADTDVFHDLRIDEQLMKAMDRKVWLPSGGSLVIDRTEAMTVIDVNTGKFTGQGGTLEQTVTRNNLEAAEEVVRQLRLRDIGGIIVIDFIDMVLESNRDLVLRRLTECLGRDRTKHQVAEVTSLGLVQMTRKRVGQGLLEAFSEPCPTCNGRGLLVHTEPLDESRRRGGGGNGSGGSGSGGGASGGGSAPAAGGRSGRRGRRGGTTDETPAADTVDAPAAADAPAAVAGPAAGEPAVAEPAAGGSAAAGRAAANGVATGPAAAAVGTDASGPALTGRIGGTPPAAEPGGAPEPTSEPTSGPAVIEPAVQADQVEPAPRRRRRAASRPAGSPATVGADSGRPAV